MLELSKRSLIRRKHEVMKKFIKLGEKDLKWLHSSAYCGEGFYVNKAGEGILFHNTQEVYGYDVHKAYVASLLNDDFPLSDELVDSPVSKLGYVVIEFTDAIKNPRYKDQSYSLFDIELLVKDSMRKDEDKKKPFIRRLEDGKFTMVLSNLDYEVITDLYLFLNLKVVKRYYFKKVGQMSEEFKDMIRECVDDLKELKRVNSPDLLDKKAEFESLWYGKEAEAQRNYWEKDKDKRGKKKFATKRGDFTFIASFQAAYLRHREWELFKRFYKNILYMATDSIYLDINIDKELTAENKLGDKLGQYGKEYDGVPILFIRRNAYIVFDKDVNINNVDIKHQRIAGIGRRTEDGLKMAPLSSQQIKRLIDINDIDDIEEAGERIIIDKKTGKEVKMKVKLRQEFKIATSSASDYFAPSISRMKKTYGRKLINKGMKGDK